MKIPSMPKLWNRVYKWQRWFGGFDKFKGSVDIVLNSYSQIQFTGFVLQRLSSQEPLWGMSWKFLLRAKDLSFSSKKVLDLQCGPKLLYSGIFSKKNISISYIYCGWAFLTDQKNFLWNIPLYSGSTIWSHLKDILTHNARAVQPPKMAASRLTWINT